MADSPITTNLSRRTLFGTLMAAMPIFSITAAARALTLDECSQHQPPQPFNAAEYVAGLEQLGFRPKLTDEGWHPFWPAPPAPYFTPAEEAFYVQLDRSYMLNPGSAGKAVIAYLNKRGGANV